MAHDIFLSKRGKENCVCACGCHCFPWWQCLLCYLSRRNRIEEHFAVKWSQGLERSTGIEQRHLRAVSDQFGTQGLGFLVLMLHLKPIKNSMDKTPACCCSGCGPGQKCSLLGDPLCFPLFRGCLSPCKYVSAQSYYPWHEKVPFRSGNVLSKKSPIRKKLITDTFREDQKS